MDIHLVVVRPFAGHARGAVVADPAQIARIVGGEHRLDVVRVMTPAAAPAPASVPSAKQGG